MELNRSIEQWRNCDPWAMATEQSDAAKMFAMEDARADILKLHADNERLRVTLAEIVRVLGPEAPDCDGCAVEIGEALRIAHGAGFVTPNVEVTGGRESV